MSDETIVDLKEVMKESQTQRMAESKKEKKKRDYKTMGISGAAGVVTAALVLTPIALFPDAPTEGSGIDGIAEEGEDALTASVSHLIGHDMDVASGVDDFMSFSEAFAAARREVGAGGIFVWHGHTYGTYYGNEWNAMSQEEQDQYWADVHQTTSNLNEKAQETTELSDVVDDGLESTQILDDREEGNSEDEQVEVAVESEAEEEIELEIEPELGMNSMAEVEIINEDSMEIEVEEDDTEGNFSEEEIVVDVDEIFASPKIEIQELNETDDLTIGQEEAIGLEDSGVGTDGDLLVNDTDIQANEDVDEFAPSYEDPGITIDNNMDMSDFS